MGFSFIASATGFYSPSGTILDCSSTLNIQEGDLIIAAAAWEDATAVATIAEDDDDNALTMLTLADDTANFQRLGYKINAAANVAATFRMTLGTARAYRSITVLQFRPDAGETVTFDAGPSSASAVSSAVQSGNISTAGNDEVVVAFEKQYSSTTESDWLIGDVAADGTVENQSWAWGWYKLFTTPQTDIHGQLTLGATPAWVCDIIAIKSEAAAGGGAVVPIIMAQMNQFGGGTRW